MVAYRFVERDGPVQTSTTPVRESVRDLPCRLTVFGCLCQVRVLEGRGVGSFPFAKARTRVALSLSSSLQ